MKNLIVTFEEINADEAEKLCRTLIGNLPDYFGLPEANAQYAQGVCDNKNIAAKIADQYVGLISLNFPYPNNCNIYWMAILQEHQSKGIGHQLINAACQFSRTLKATSMSVETLSPLEADQNYLKTYQFYESCGFKPLFNLKPHDYEWNMVYMVKPLSHALDKLLHIEQDARAFGFEWPDTTTIIDQAIDECREIKEAIAQYEPPLRIQEEIGDLLHTAISLCVFMGFDVEETIQMVNRKFGGRVNALKGLTHQLNMTTLHGHSFDFMLGLWKQAKIMHSSHQTE